MIAGLPLAFTQPLVLLGLLSLPVLWLLLRLIPPRPKRVTFPPTRLLFDIAPKEETPSRTPWWLTLLRLTLAALVIIAAAGPLWNPRVATSSATVPLALMIDDGWAAAATWDARLRTGDDMLARADADHRPVALIPLSEPTRDISLQTAAAARVRFAQMKPKPHAVDRSDALPVISRFAASTPSVEFVWLSDGVDAGEGKAFIGELARLLERRPVMVLDGGLPPPQALAASDNAAGALTVKVLRAASGQEQTGMVRALDLKGLPLGEARYAFKAADRQTEAAIELPVEIRNDIARIEIPLERSAGAVQLLDKRWRRRTVGLVSGSTADTAQPLLAANYYLARALNPFADVRPAQGVAPTEAVSRFLNQNLPMLVLADVGTIAGEARARLSKWIENGGVLVRFAGPRLAAATDDDLVPVKLRRGGRSLGGSLSWDQPQPLAAFPREGPFAGMPVPDDVVVNRQVLAEPDATLSDRTWATLGDGTPLVTAERQGKGLIVLFHVSADTRWSNLPLSGAFVEMLKRLVSLAGSTFVTADTEGPNAQLGTRDQPVPPSRILDGFGVMSAPPGTARPIPANFSGRATTDHPPGFYGPPEGLIAVNTLTPADELAPLDYSALNARVEAYRVGEPEDLRGPVFLAGLALLLLDALVVFWLAGAFSAIFRRRRPAVAGLLLAAMFGGGLLMNPRAHAQDAEDFAMKAAQHTRLAYVVTGNAEVDEVSKAGLQGLTLFLAQRTALEAGDPVGVDIARDELAFFPLIYWPIVPGAAKPPAEALQRIDAYMKRGGSVLFDTRDAVEAPPGPGGASNTPGMLTLRDILSSLDIPELEPAPRDHVLTKTFYLLRDFAGRFNTGQLWVEALPLQTEEDPERPARAGDGVSSILITSNDLAGAWAIRPDGQAMLPLVPGEPRQREFAFRAGVNIVMYILTGNYKADQVHVPALLERLGQ
ncbi:MAG: DUF4159 domain-containing protein [Rhizobiales bacterium]|nr:DUF4159 domain-containing protein [Hyphomicrobiales bacterium]